MIRVPKTLDLVSTAHITNVSIVLHKISSKKAKTCKSTGILLLQKVRVEQRDFTLSKPFEYLIFRCFLKWFTSSNYSLTCKTTQKYQEEVKALLFEWSWRVLRWIVLLNELATDWKHFHEYDFTSQNLTDSTLFFWLSVLDLIFIVRPTTGCDSGGRCDWMQFDRLFTRLRSCGSQASGGNKHPFSSAVTEENSMLSLSHLALASFTSLSGTLCYDVRMSSVPFLLIRGHYCLDTVWLSSYLFYLSLMLLISVSP